MTQDISKATAPPAVEKEKAPEKEYWIVEVLKKLLELHKHKYGVKKKF